MEKTDADVEKESCSRPSWVPSTVHGDEDLCPDCFKVVGERSRYRIVCMLGKSPHGMTVSEITKKIGLRQPTITHHLQALSMVGAVNMDVNGREHVYKLNRDTHCFAECNIPY